MSYGTFAMSQPTFFHRAVRFFRDHKRDSWSRKQIEDALLDIEVDAVIPPPAPSTFSARIIEEYNPRENITKQEETLENAQNN